MTIRGDWWAGTWVAEYAVGALHRRLRSAVHLCSVSAACGSDGQCATVCQRQTQLPALSCRAVGKPGHTPEQRRAQVREQRSMCAPALSQWALLVLKHEALGCFNTACRLSAHCEHISSLQAGAHPIKTELLMHAAGSTL